MVNTLATSSLLIISIIKSPAALLCVQNEGPRRRANKERD
jgi:hypothetical protein